MAAHKYQISTDYHDRHSRTHSAGSVVVMEPEDVCGKKSDVNPSGLPTGWLDLGPADSGTQYSCPPPESDEPKVSGKAVADVDVTKPNPVAKYFGKKGKEE